MKPNEIRAALLMKNVRLADIADRIGVSRSSVSNVIHGRFKSTRIQEEIAHAIGKGVTEIWPQWAA